MQSAGPILTSTLQKRIISGPAGVGKTLLAKFKILEMVNRGEFCAVFVPENLKNEYDDFLRQNIANHLELKNLYRSTSMSAGEINLKEIITGENIFIDDSQHFYRYQRLFTPENKSKIDDLVSEKNDKYFWLFCDTSQFLIKGPLLIETFEIWECMKDIFELNAVMRNTTKITDLAAKLRCEINYRSCLKWRRPEIFISKAAESLQYDTFGVLNRPSSSARKIVACKENKPSVTERMSHLQLTKAHMIDGPSIQIISISAGSGNQINLKELIRGLDSALSTMTDMHDVAIIYSTVFVPFFEGTVKDAQRQIVSKRLGDIIKLAAKDRERNKNAPLKCLYTFQTSSMEFSTVVFVLSIPADFEKCRETQITVLSEIYTAVT